mmetsp:Transcript_12248/g.22218  ORF Transcript_12248/g.22218 Transcript_12248/m.22218 type:complete len:87 (+) Transcript_12248:66-326(+)
MHWTIRAKTVCTQTRQTIAQQWHPSGRRLHIYVHSGAKGEDVEATLGYMTQDEASNYEKRTQHTPTCQQNRAGILAICFIPKEDES